MSNLPEATGKIVEVLSSFNTDERMRIVRASLMLLGEEFSTPKAQSNSPKSSGPNQDDGEDDPTQVHASAQQWMRKSEVSSSQLEHFFHFEQGQVTPIAILGNATSRKDQTVNAYIGVGLAAYLASGESSFSDAAARKFCEQSGCYDSANHAKSIKGFKNRITGSKASGWKLTAPGLSFAAELVKQLKS